MATDFFFQAEDGIRDKLVTGVQTCALPIWTGPPALPPARSCPLSSAAGGPVLDGGDGVSVASAGGAGAPSAARSEERRVGKECRFRWSRYHTRQTKLV